MTDPIDILKRRQETIKARMRHLQFVYGKKHRKYRIEATKLADVERRLKRAQA